MKPHFQDDAVTLWHGDCLDVLRTLPDASVDSVVTDPPYGLEFMGKDWDGADGFRRSLNPADVGRDNAFGRTSKTSPEYRTDSKAQATRRQEGGIRQATGPSFMGGLNPKCLICNHWQRGSNPCKCEAPEWTQERLVRLHSFQEWCEAWSAECLRVLKPGGYMLAFSGTRTFHRLACAVEDAGFEIRDSIAWLYGSGFPKHRAALKPAFEPIVMARKPFGTSLIVNEAKYGTGALNIDGCRVGDVSTIRVKPGGAGDFPHEDDAWVPRPVTCGSDHGRWPANVVLDGSQADALDAQSGTLHGSGNIGGTPGNGLGYMGSAAERRMPAGHGDSGGASRFFPIMGRDGEASADRRYTDAGGTDFAATPGARREPVAKSQLFPTFRYEAKAPTSERPRHGEVAHPTVKPLDLMRWLVRLVTPQGGTVLEPFAGSGTTAEACILEGFKCIAIEREADYLPLIVQRISKPLQVGLNLNFGASA